MGLAEIPLAFYVPSESEIGGTSTRPDDAYLALARLRTVMTDPAYFGPDADLGCSELVELVADIVVAAGFATRS